MPTLKGSSSVGPPDLLTNLPKGIIIEILGRVPIREAVRTSVLSSQWRYRWCSIPNLAFDDSCVKLPNHTYMPGETLDSPFVSFVNRVLLLHQGPVHNFQVIRRSRPEFSDINQWVTFLSRNGINELFLKFGYYAKAPSSLFQCSELTTLTLGCFQILELPVSFKGFKSLKILYLANVTISVCSLEKLISGCPLLECLRLYDSHSEVLEIHAPLLKRLTLEGKFLGFILKKTPLLEEISLTMIDDTEHSCTLYSFIDQVPSLKKLFCLGYFAKYWNVGKDPTTITITSNHLRFIMLSIDFEDPTEVRLLILLLRSSPVLKELEIIGASGESSSSDSEFCSEAQDLGCRQLSQLNKAKVTVSGSSSEIVFVKFVLLNSPALETLTVTPSSDLKDGSKKILVDLLMCRRASTKAEVVFCDR